MPQSNLARKVKPTLRLAGRPMTSFMADALAFVVKNGGLNRYRVGYAPEPKPPFIPHDTIEGLLDRGLLGYRTAGGRVSPTKSGLAALAKYREENPPAPTRYWWVDP